ncbi:MAG: hypothetical protein IT436_13090 [Phycisphaerales bacterium]|nr:hypothetical protein [Phycisphaerales bacterium]
MQGPGSGHIDRGRKKRAAVGLRLLTVIAAMAILLCGASELGRWSVFWAGKAKVVVNPLTEAPPAPIVICHERGEIHFMLGRGRFSVFSYRVTKNGEMDTPRSDEGSRVLAWLVSKDRMMGRWSVGASWSDGNGPQLTVQVWMPTVILVGLAVWVWWRWARRAEAGCCARCGYDLRGLRRGSVCPECGTAVTAAV